MDRFIALERIGTDVELIREMRICEDLKRAQGGRGLGVGVKLSFWIDDPLQPDNNCQMGKTFIDASDEIQ